MRVILVTGGLGSIGSHTAYWIVDNGSSHAGRASIERLEGGWQNLRLVHLPIHASRLNQIELYDRVAVSRVKGAARGR